MLRVRWPVLHGVRGEGIQVRPKDTQRTRVLCILDAGVTPEALIQSRLLSSGGEFLVAALDRW